MNIIFCPPMYLPAHNGTVTYVEQLKKEFKGRVVTSDCVDWVFKKRIKDSKALRCRTYRMPFLLRPFCPSMIKKLRNAELVHSCTLPYFNNFAASISKGKKVCSPFFIPRIHDKWINYKILKRFDKIISITNYEKEFLKKKGIESEYIPLTTNEKPGDAKAFRKKYEINDDFVLFAGIRNYEKGAYHLLEAIPYMLKERPDLKFVFIGTQTQGFHYKRRHSQYRNSIITFSYMPKMDAFNACSVYCQPSRMEAFGYTTLEAWACKKPVIIADTPATREVSDGCAKLVEFGDAKKIAESILECLENKELGIKGFKKLQTEYNYKKIMNKMRNLYESLL